MFEKRLEHDFKSFLDLGNADASHRDAAINNKYVLLRGQGRPLRRCKYIFHPIYPFNQNMRCYLGFSRRN